MTDDEIMQAYDVAKTTARLVARCMLHPDECESAAGLAVAEAIHDHYLSRGGSFKSWVCYKTRCQVLMLMRKELRYKHNLKTYREAMRRTELSYTIKLYT